MKLPAIRHLFPLLLPLLFALYAPGNGAEKTAPAADTITPAVTERLTKMSREHPRLFLTAAQ
ncbi:MAG: hypothetical protein HZA31_07670, partial [Opitutae bacterium]|nr:hypothetical protein [Opitutae bacterium]